MCRLFMDFRILLVCLFFPFVNIILSYYNFIAGFVNFSVKFSSFVLLLKMGLADLGDCQLVRWNEYTFCMPSNFCRIHPSTN